MDEYRIKKIIEKLLKNHLAKKAIIILNSGKVYENEIFEIVKKYDCIEYKHILSDNATKVHNNQKWKDISTQIEDIEDIEKYISECDFIILPFLTRNTLAKITIGIADTNDTYAVQLALMMGKNVICLDSSWNPENDNSRLKKINLNSTYNKMLFEYRNKMEKLGVSFVGVYDLESEIEKVIHNESVNIETVKKDTYIVENENLKSIYFTKEDIVGKESICISKKDKLTDLAKEYIIEKNMKVDYIG